MCLRQTYVIAVIDGCDDRHYGRELSISLVGQRKAEPTLLNILPAKAAGQYTVIGHDGDETSRYCENSSACGPGQGKAEPSMLFSLPPVITASVISADAASAPATDHNYLHVI